MRMKGREEHKYSWVYFSEQPQVAEGLGAGGDRHPQVVWALSSSVLSLLVLAIGRREHTEEKRDHSVGVPASTVTPPPLSRAAREALPCPKSASGEQRMEG